MKILILGLVLLVFVLPSFAEDKLPVMPEASDLDINTFVANSRLVTNNVTNDPLLKFQIQVPNGYIVKPDNVLKNIEIDNHIFGEIFIAYGPPIEDMRPYIKIQSIELDRLISAKNWMVTKALEWGYTIRGIEVGENDDSFEAFYIRLDSFGRTEIIRARGFLHENRLILVEHILPISLWQDSKDKQIYTIKSFEFLNEYPIQSPEPISSFSYLDNFYFEYPESWHFQLKNMDNVNRLDVALKTTNINNFILAETNLTVISNRSLKDRIDQTVYPTNLADIVKKRISDVEELGYAPDPVLEEYKYELSFKEDFQATEVYPLRKKTSSVYITEDVNAISKEFWITVIKKSKEEGKNYIITMIAPSRKNNLNQWAIAVKAYEEMIESIR